MFHYHEKKINEYLEQFTHHQYNYLETTDAILNRNQIKRLLTFGLGSKITDQDDHDKNLKLTTSQFSMKTRNEESPILAS